MSKSSSSRSFPKQTEGGARPPVISFEVEIQTGNRADDSRQASVERTTEGKQPRTMSPLAVQRRARALQRKRLLTVAGLVAAILLVSWGTAIYWQPMLFGEVVARVNGQPITTQEVDREVNLSKAFAGAKGGKEQAPSPPAMLEQMILTELEDQAAQKANFTVSAQVVDDEVASELQQSGVTLDKLDESLRSYGLTREALRASVARVVLANQYADQVVAGGATDSQTRFSRINKWQADLVQAATIERLRTSTTGIAPRVGEQAPDFALNRIDGGEVRLSSLRGKAVILYMWAPWCAACRAEVPILEQAYQARGKDGSADFEIMAVATHSEASNVKAFMQEFGMTFPVFMDGSNSVTDLYQVGPIPTSFFVDRDGVIRAVQVGQMDSATLQKQLRTVR